MVVLALLLQRLQLLPEILHLVLFTVAVKLHNKNFER